MQFPTPGGQIRPGSFSMGHSAAEGTPMKVTPLVSMLLVAATVSSCGPKEPAITPAEVRAIAKEAYIYGFPMVDNYRVMYAYFVDATGPEFKEDWNRIANIARVFTPEDKAIQTPNSDTPYSFVGADLRAEPLVFTVPPIDKGRYYSLQFIDLYTFNFAYVGSRATGNGGGTFLLAGPDWQGETPPGITQVIRCETQFALVGYRTQLFDAKDMRNVKEIQGGYKVQPLSRFLGQATRTSVEPVTFRKPLTTEEERTSLEFFDVLNFVLQFCPPDPSETELMAKFAKIGVGPGLGFDLAGRKPEIVKAIEDGRADAWAACDSVTQLLLLGKISSGDLFGTREFLAGNYLYRMNAAVNGIYGNSRDEALYFGYAADASGQALDGTVGYYTLRFAPNQLPPVNAFWSITMYAAKSKLLVANSIERYLINSPMLPKLRKDKDGGLTLYMQYASPGPGKQTNWLPSPAGPFTMVLRLYAPKPAAYDGTWKRPEVQRTQG